jgi:hypothetical protein
MQVDENVTAFETYNKFVSGQQVALVQSKLIARLSGSQPSKSSIDLSVNDVFTAFTACSYDIVVNNTQVTNHLNRRILNHHHDQENWCTLFDDCDVEVINYAFDLEDYTERGYDFDVTWKVQRQ